MSKTVSSFHQGRHAGLLLPLFSAPSDRSWGIGEITDLPVLCSWLREAGFDFVQVLPVNEMATGQHSPYSAVSAMAIDPIFIGVGAVAEFSDAGGEASLSTADRAALAEVRSAPRIDYTRVRSLKMDALRACFQAFLEKESRRGSARAAALGAFIEREGWWLDDYVLFRALRDRHDARAWWTWGRGLTRRKPAALAEARRALADDCLFHAYLQWLADAQWQAARAASAPVGIFGDLPFMVGGDSADVWAFQHAFMLDATVGAPPDAFSETGQDWGLPAYRWDVFEAEDDRWIRERARRNAELFDGYRVDHLVGFYRTYVIPGDGAERWFSPADEPAQLTQGERLMRAFAEPGARIIAEDLGTVPPFVRDSLLRLGIPGYKVLRWEREWDLPDQPFRDPLEYPAASVATTGTHDTETLVEWWENADPEERALVAQIPFFETRALDVESGRCDPATRDALLEVLAASGSEFLILPAQDVFGWRDRVNLPGTVSDDNWTWRLPWPVDELGRRADARERASVLRRWMRQYHRCSNLFRRVARGHEPAGTGLAES